MAVALAQGTAVAGGVGAGTSRPSSVPDAGDRAWAVPAQSQGQWFDRQRGWCTLGLARATAQGHRQIGRRAQWREQGARSLLRLGDRGHGARDALAPPRLYDHLDTGLGIPIGTSHTLQRVASGWWEVVRNLHDARAITLIPPPEVASALSTGM